MPDRSKDRLINKVSRQVKASKKMRIDRLIRSGKIKAVDDLPEGAIPALISEQKHDDYSECPQERLWYVDVDFFCKDCNSKQTWTAIEQVYYYETLKGKILNMATRCTECRIKHEEYSKLHTLRMREATEQRRIN